MPKSKTSKQAKFLRKAATFPIRILGYRKKRAASFRFNPLNPKVHPEAQRGALRTMLSEIGWVQGVIENKRTGNLIDGHARIEEELQEDPNQVVPYLVVDLSPAEEKAILATLDPIGAMAEVDPELVDQLYQETIDTMPTIEDLLRSLNSNGGELEETTPATKTVEFKQTFKIVIECTSERRRKQIGRILEANGIEFQVK
jgi:hypothetical protein